LRSHQPVNRFALDAEAETPLGFRTFASCVATFETHEAPREPPELSMVPALAFFVFAERRITGGLTGAIKA
jgi:hypothetical protein